MILGLGLGLGLGLVGFGFVSLSIGFGEAAGPFRLYGGPLCSWTKGGKTAGSHIRPYAALRVPSLRCPPGATRPTTCFAKSTTRALRLRRRGLRPSPFRTPPLGLLKSQVTGGVLRDGSSKSKAVRTARCASVSVFDLAFALDARESRRRQLRLQPAEWRCL